ncbi:MAG: hypothetical protein WD875_03365 [Pirellulales bacterium]
MSLVAAGTNWTNGSPVASVWIVAARRSFRGGEMSWVIAGTLGVLAIAAVWMVARWWLGEGAARMRNSPKALFGELCRAHALAASERQLLLSLADCRRLAQPSDVFVDPSHFDNPQLPPLLASRKGELARLRGRLFAGLEPPSIAENTAAEDAATGDAAADESPA